MSITTAVLDDFNRAGTTAPPSASWAALFGLTPVLALSGDTATARSNTAGAQAQCYWNAAQYGPDCEVWATLSALNVGGNISCVLYGRLQNPTNGSTATGYEIDIFSDGSAAVYAVAGSGHTALHTFTSITGLAAGSSVGMVVTGSGATVTIELWHKPSGGSWGLVDSYADTSGGRVTSAGYTGLGVGTQTGGDKVTDFGAGSHASTVTRTIAPSIDPTVGGSIGETR